MHFKKQKTKQNQVLLGITVTEGLMNLRTSSPHVEVSLGGVTLNLALLPMGLAAPCMATGSHWFAGGCVSGDKKRL